VKKYRTVNVFSLRFLEHEKNESVSPSSASDCRKNIVSPEGSPGAPALLLRPGEDEDYCKTFVG